MLLVFDGDGGGSYCVAASLANGSIGVSIDTTLGSSHIKGSAGSALVLAAINYNILSYI